MNILQYVILLIVCGPEPGLGQYQLSVFSGYGSGIYSAGENVHVFANNTPREELVTGWDSTVNIGATDGEFGLNGEWHFSFKMPESDVTLMPKFSKTSVIQEQLQELKDLKSSKGRKMSAFYYIPKEPIGLVGFFHGTRGSRRFLLNSQPWYTASKFIRAGYGVFSADAQESIDNAPLKRWNTKWESFCDNYDMQNIKLILDRFLGMGLITNKTKLHAIGMSNGGVFAYSLVQAGGLGFSSGVSTCAHGDLKIDPSLPFMWQMCGNDAQPSVAKKKGNSIANYEKLVRKSISAIHVTHPASPVYPERFSRIDGVSLGTSKNLYSYMRDKHIITETNFVLLDFESKEEFAKVMENSQDYKELSGQQKRELLAELQIAAARHKYYDDYSEEVLAFFQANDEPGNFAHTSITCPAKLSWWVIVLICISGFVLVFGFYFLWKKYRRNKAWAYKENKEDALQEIAISPVKS